MEINNLRTGMSILIFGVVFALLGAAGLILSPMDVLSGEFAETGGILLLTGWGFAAIGAYVTILARREKFLMANWIDGKAKLLEYTITTSGDEVRYRYRCKFKLEVTAAGNAPYTVTTRQTVSRSLLSHMDKGMVVPVKMHPEKPNISCILKK